MEETEQTPIIHPKQQFYIKPLFAVILCLFIVSTFVGGYWIGKTKINTNKQVTQNTSNPPSLKDITTKFEFTNNIDSSFVLLTSPSFAKEIKGKLYEPLQCLGSSNNPTYGDDKLTIDKIKVGINDTALISGLEKIQNNEYDYLARSYKEDGKTIDKEKMIKTKADIDLYSVCKDQETIYILYNANISWSSIQKQLFSLVSQAYAAGGPQYTWVPYLAKISQSGDVKYFKLGSESSKNTFFSPISLDILKQYGYIGERRPEMLFPEQILGKIDNTILTSFETKCYECRDNPMERSLYAISLDSLNAKEISFCRNYESSEQQCYDQQGMFASIK